MPQIKIDTISVEVPEGISILQAAKSQNIHIPSMCFREGHHNHPSCMVCLVKDLNTGKMLPSCAYPVSEGMNISTNSPDVLEARKESLELLMSDHVGDCEAPCTLACPASMNIPEMNRLIAAGNFDEALLNVRKEIALPFILGYICPAPCEKACRRKQIDEAVSICMLKRFTAQDDIRRNANLLLPEKKTGKKIAIIGSGAAGLSAAFYLLRLGYSCVLFDKNEEAGGEMRYSISEEKMPRNVLNSEIELLKQMGAEFQQNFLFTKQRFEELKQSGFSGFILAFGNQPKEFIQDLGFETDTNGIKTNKNTFETSKETIFACGNSLRKQQMGVRAGAQARIAAFALHERLSGKQPTGETDRFNSSFGRLFEEEFAEYLKESTEDKRIVAKEGFLKGFTEEEAQKEAARCLHCDCRKLSNCKLRDLCDESKVDKKRFLATQRNTLSKHFHHETVVYEPEKCIRCGLCVEITQNECEPIGLTYVGRGFDVRISVPFSLTVKEALEKTAHDCIEACPTGALATK